MTEQPVSAPHSADPPVLDTAPADGAVVQAPRRQPGDPHPYMLQRNPPNLWILAAVTVFSLVLTVLVMVLTVVL